MYLYLCLHGRTDAFGEICISAQGTLPADLQGTLYRNGPGNFDYGEDTLNHPFDGDGLVWSLTFDNGNIVARRRFVRTKALKEEMEAGA